MTTIKQNALIAVYLADHNPSWSVEELVKRLFMAPLDVSAALWLAQEKGWLEEPVEGQPLKVALPPSRDFGPEVEQLKKLVTYALWHLSQTQQDIEEDTLIEYWLQSYPLHHSLVALQSLQEEGVIARYRLKDSGNKDGIPVEYNFFTLFANKGQLWGKKQFKRQYKVKEVKEE